MSNVLPFFTTASGRQAAIDRRGAHAILHGDLRDCQFASERAYCGFLPDHCSRASEVCVLTGEMIRLEFELLHMLRTRNQKIHSLKRQQFDKSSFPLGTL